MVGNTLTKKQQDLFKSEFNLWVDRFNLVDYNVYFRFEALGPDLSTIEVDQEHMAAVVVVNTHPLHPQTNNDIKDTARHEAIHLLLSEFSHAAVDRFTDAKILTNSEERVTNRLCAFLDNFVKERNPT